MKAYVCGTDWLHECQDVIHTVTFFGSTKLLKKTKSCWKECGIVEVEITQTKVIEQSKFRYGKLEDK